MFAFDWYQGTPARAMPGPQLFDILAGHYPEGEVKTGRGVNRYDHTCALEVDGERVFTVAHGGHNTRPNAWSTSHHAIRFAEVMRNEVPEHNVTRAHPCMDFHGGHFTFDLAYDFARTFADDRSISTDYAGDWNPNGDSERGRTFYIGGRKAVVRGRLYEKGKEQNQLAIRRGLAYDDDRNRLEFDCKPQGDARRMAATMTPDDMLGIGGWTWQFVERFLGLTVPIVKLAPKPVPKLERRWQAHDDQWSGLFMETLQGPFGNDEVAFMRWVLDRQRQVQTARQERKARREEEGR